MNTTTFAVQTATLDGISARSTWVVAKRLPGQQHHFEVRGLSDAAGRELRVRIRSALSHVGIGLDTGNDGLSVTFDSYASCSSGADLAAAIAVLALLGEVPRDSLPGRLFLGELSLSGELRQIRGVLPALLSASDFGREAIVPLACEAEAAEAVAEGPGFRAFAAASLSDVIGHLRGETLAECQHHARRTLAELGPLPASLAGRVAATVGARVLIVGRPGSGKTMIAQRLTAALPKPSRADLLEVTCVHSAAGILRENCLTADRPFRAPHHTASAAALVGGGAPPRPGEASLAHAGVLFLDELTEFSAQALRSLGAALSEGRATLVRSKRSVTFPAAPAMVVASANPCPCGYRGDPRRMCSCTPERIQRHEARLDECCRILGITERVNLHQEETVNAP